MDRDVGMPREGAGRQRPTRQEGCFWERPPHGHLGLRLATSVQGQQKPPAATTADDCVPWAPPAAFPPLCSAPCAPGKGLSREGHCVWSSGGLDVAPSLPREQGEKT